MGFFYSGGGERTAIYEALGLQERGYSISCFAPIVRHDQSFPELLRKIQVESFLPKFHAPIPLREAFSMVASSILSPALASRFKPYDVFLCHGQPSMWMGYVLHRMLKKPYICYIHQPNRFLYPRKIDIETGWKVNPSLRVLNFLVSRTWWKEIRRLDKLSVENASTILANSNWTARRLAQIYDLPARVVYPGIDARQLRRNADLARKLPNKYVSKRPFVLSTNRHYPQKRLDWLIYMMIHILARLPEANLILTGRATSYTASLMKLCKDLGVDEHVTFSGEVNEFELAQLYSTATLCAYAAPEEDFGLGPPEAGICNTPSVVWNYAGPSETVLDGITGYRAVPYNLSDFAEKISQLLTDEELRNRLGENAREHVEKNFTWDRHTAQLEEVIASVIRRDQSCISRRRKNFNSSI